MFCDDSSHFSCSIDMSFQISQNKKALKNAMELQAYVLQAIAKALKSIIPASQSVTPTPLLPNFALPIKH